MAGDLAEAKRNRGRILLHGERDVANCSTLAAWGEVYSYWEPVDSADGSVLTSRQAFEMVFREFNNKSTTSAFDDASSSNSTSTTQALPRLRDQARQADAHVPAVPVPDEKSPGPKEFDIVERAVRDAHSSGAAAAGNAAAATSFVFNCQLGRGAPPRAWSSHP